MIFLKLAEKKLIYEIIEIIKINERIVNIFSVVGQEEYFLLLCLDTTYEQEHQKCV